MPADREKMLKILESDELLEQLASIEHERWSHWQSYLHDQCIEGENGELTIPAELASRWTTQMNTPYKDLSEAERQSDRDQVRRYLPLIIKMLSHQE